MASKTAAKRLSKEYAAMQQDPPPFVCATPDEKNILNWHFLVRGPPDSPYAGGEYHGMIMFPSEYPFRPPGIKMLTPSGRFLPDKKICFSMSDFHPGTWNPAWSVATILTGLLSFMLSNEITTGSMSSSTYEKKVLAGRSHGWNIQQKRFKDAFPDYCTSQMKDLPNMGEKEKGVAETSTLASDVVNGDSATTSSATTHGSAAQRRQVRGRGPGRGAPQLGDALGWASVGRAVWEKWRWGALIIIAVVVSKLSASS